MEMKFLDSIGSPRLLGVRPYPVVDILTLRVSWSEHLALALLPGGSLLILGMMSDRVGCCLRDVVSVVYVALRCFWDIKVGWGSP